MRTLILSIVCLLTLNKLVAQQSNLAFLDTNTIETENLVSNNYTPALTRPNSIYLKEHYETSFSRIVKQWRKRIVNYILKDVSVFDNSEKATYRIIFKNKQVNIIANYDNNGKILSTNETYKNIKIPFELRRKISKAHPNYAYLKNSYHLTYSNENGIEKEYYKIQIGKGNKEVTLKYNENFKSI